VKVQRQPPSEFKGIALTATAQQIDDLLYLVANATGYRDWDWLDDWLMGRGPQDYSPDMVIRIFASHDYWEACKAGDTVKLESVKHAILGVV